MAGLKFFVSSTCYDLSEERNQLRNLIKNLGHEPILSDHNEILYDFDEHTHISCVREIPNADIVVLIIGSRYGGKAINETTKLINFEEVQKQLHGNNLNVNDIFTKINEERKVEREKELDTSIPYKAKSIGFSITHFEILKAIEEHIPIYVFIKDKVANFYDFYIQNKEKNPELTFPDFSIYETKYLAEFIGILKLRRTNNSIFEFNSYLDIEIQLKQQLALKFRSLLLKEKNDKKETREQRSQVELLSNQFDDLKTAILSTLPKGQEKTVAKGVLKYRLLLNCMSNLLHIQNKVEKNNPQIILERIIGYKENFHSFLMNEIKVTKILFSDELEPFTNEIRKLKRAPYEHNGLPIVCDRNDGFIFFRGSVIFEKMVGDWDSFLTQPIEIKKLIVEALNDEDLLFGKTLDFIVFSESFSQYIKNFHQEKTSEDQNAYSIKEFFIKNV